MLLFVTCAVTISSVQVTMFSATAAHVMAQ